ncbi:Pectate lyase/Amb allergen [Cinnamomum micranthum f. kanehirae]|uniref:Pectate lyase n=1 Tax=Cinnamomum micranthum f. kanehirae TaxID=337451 RepID=A0A3S4NFT1_9MAGN|nr:Pectate lyase/Amb allergen [Cinnamomum micranthum f. kanehirae]
MMGLFWVSFALFIFQFWVVGSGQMIGRSCGTITGTLERDVVRDLYWIEVEWKRLVGEEELSGERKQFDEIPMILHHFLARHYGEVERSLQGLLQGLSLLAEDSLTGSVYLSEATIDFSKKALLRAQQAQHSIIQLMQCKSKNTTIDQKQQVSGIPTSVKKRNETCEVDGTKCQFSPCAQGNRLPICAVGFAAGTTGGAGGPYYTVTRSDDNDPGSPDLGSLRYAVNFAEQNRGGAWIIFKDSMVIRLKEKLWISSNTTIDGRGVNVTIIGKGLVLARVENVILHNLEVVSTGQSDTVHIFDGSHHVWIDHLSSRDGNLGLVTVLQGSTDVTISNCYLSNHNFNMLLGASDEDVVDRILRVTVYRNWFDSSNQRMPHCRWGYCHVVNNYYSNWKYYAIGGRAHAKVLSELNVFKPEKRLEVTPWYEDFKSDLTPTIQSFKDLLMKGATFHQFLNYGPLSFPQSEFSPYQLPRRPTESLVDLVTNCSGVVWGSKLGQCLATP